MARKRAPGAGKKPRGEYAGLAATLSIRMPADMRAGLERSAAKRRQGGWSLTQEILWRLQRSFDRERDERRDPASRALCYLLAEVIAAVASNTAGPNWRADPFAFQTIKLTFGQLMDFWKPPGEIVAREMPQSEPYAGIWALPGTLNSQLRGRTPEEMAHFICGAMLMRMRQDAYEEPPEANQEAMATISPTSTQKEFEFGMSAAVRALKLKEPNQ